MVSKLFSIDKLLSPSFLYIAGFIIPFSLVYIGFSRYIPFPSEKTTITIILGIVFFYLGIIFSSIVLSKVEFRTRVKKSLERQSRSYSVHLKDEKKTFITLCIFWILGLSCLFYEFYELGTIPLLDAEIEKVRFLLQTNGYIHLIAISTGFFSYLFFVFRYFSKSIPLKRASLAIIFISIPCLSMTANRVDFLYPVFLMILFFILNEKIIFSRKFALVIFAFSLAFISLNFYRSLSYSDEFIEKNLQGLGDGFEKSSINLALYPLYLTFTYSFEILNRLVNSGAEGITYGKFTFHAIYSLLPGPQESFGEFKNNFLGIDFYSELTSTYLSNFYVDFGLYGVMFFSFVYGGVCQTNWIFFIRDKKYGLLYTIFAATILFSFYSFYFVFFYALFQVFASLIFIKNFKKEGE